MQDTEHTLLVYAFATGDALEYVPGRTFSASASLASAADG